MFKTLFFAKSILTILIAQNLRWIRAHLALFLAVHFFSSLFYFFAKNVQYNCLNQSLCFTVFENHRKSLIQHCERSELRLHLSEQKLSKNAKNGPIWRVFENLKLAVKQCYQTGQF